MQSKTVMNSKIAVQFLDNTNFLFLLLFVSCSMEMDSVSLLILKHILSSISKAIYHFMFRNNEQLKIQH